MKKIDDAEAWLFFWLLLQSLPAALAWKLLENREKKLHRMFEQIAIRQLQQQLLLRVAEHKHRHWPVLLPDELAA